ncbi:MAG: site-specific integrase [Acidimicrobiales bacterium]|nr:site-specific integrase [Acidimicrobiales bacterium]
MTLAEFARGEWLPSMRGRLKPSTWDSYRRNMELHVLPQLGSSLLTELTPRSLNVLYGGLLEHGKRNGRGGLSATTVRYIHVIIHGALADAADLGLVAANPASRAKPPRVNRPVHESSAWNADELQTFLRSVADDRIYPAIHLAALTGMRRGEILGLQWGDVDLPNSRLVVRHTLVSIGYQVQESTPKTHRPRQVELDEGSSSTLQRHRSATITSGQETGFGDLVFTDDAGERLHPDLFTQRFDRLVARSGLRRIRLHDLRHTHATLALAAGVPVRVMSERLGHASPEFTMRQYQHVLPGMQAAAAQQIADLVSGGAN